MAAVAVLGAGAWGTALATAFGRTGGTVRLWGRHAADAEAGAMSLPPLPGVQVPPRAGRDLAAALDGADVIVAAVPAQALRALALAIRPLASPDAPIVICAKGIEQPTGLFLSQVIGETMPGHRIAVLSGPSFAADVGRGLPTAVTIAAQDLDEAAALGARLGSASLRLYHSDDVRGVEIGGAAKNVLAIACGIAAGRGLGASAVAALTARAFAELSRFGRALGGRAETLAGLSGLGDLVLTCGSAQSRNYGFGAALGAGRPISAAAPDRLVEGVWTAPILVRLARDNGVDMPICAAVAAVLDGRLDIDGAIERLMNRPMKAET